MIAAALALCLPLSAVAQRSGLKSGGISMQEMLNQTAQICREVEAVRGLQFTSAVPAEVQSQADFITYVTNSVIRQYGEEESRGYVAALVKLGALDKPVNLVTTIVDLATSQAIAHYDPHKKTFYMLMTNMPAQFLGSIAAHELCHALQDQRHDLYSFAEKDVAALRDNGDATLARQCLIEGEATHVMLVWMLSKELGADESGFADMLTETALRMQDVVEFGSLADMAKMSGMEDDSGQLRKSLDDIERLPRFFTETMYAAYMKGALMVHDLKKRGGWEAIEELYANPPESTEQILHPEKLKNKRDRPVDVRMPELQEALPAGWKLKEEDVLGEMGIRILLSIWKQKSDGPQAAPAAAAGWGGDRYYYFENAATNRDLLVWKTVWDTPADADEFAMACRLMFAKRFPDMKKAGRSGPDAAFRYQAWEIEPGRFLKLVTADRLVGFVDTTDKALLGIAW